jgi:hypothetical protein
MRIGNKTYNGNGTDDRNITHDIVGASSGVCWCIICRTDTTSLAAMHRNSGFSGDASAYYGGGVYSSDSIQGFVTNGATQDVQIGTSTRVNSGSGTTIYVLTTCLEDLVQVKSGTYVGNGTALSISDVGFQPDIVLIKRDGATGGCYKTDTMGANQSVDLSGNPTLTTGITSFDAGGFTLGDSLTANGSGSTYTYTAWKKKSGYINTGTYAGNDADDRNIPHGLSGTPKIVLIVSIQTNIGYFRPGTIVVDQSWGLDTTGYNSDRIQAIDSTNFQVGTSANVNLSGRAYHWFALTDDTGEAAAAPVRRVIMTPNMGIWGQG